MLKLTLSKSPSNPASQHGYEASQHGCESDSLQN